MLLAFGSAVGFSISMGLTGMYPLGCSTGMLAGRGVSARACHLCKSEVALSGGGLPPPYAS